MTHSFSSAFPVLNPISSNVAAPPVRPAAGRASLGGVGKEAAELWESSGGLIEYGDCTVELGPGPEMGRGEGRCEA